MPRRLSAAVFLLIAAACHRPGEPSRATISQSLQGVLVYPGSHVVTMASGDSAGQLTLASPAPAESVAHWFRQMLLVNGWTLESDAKQPDGSVLMYAERGRRPLWIAIQEATGGPGTSYSVTGAIVGSVDTTKAGNPADSAQRSGSSMSSKRIQR
jgi:hypothetical protein